MNETEIKNLLRLLHSEDGQNALLAVSMLWGFEMLPKSLQLALGLICYLEKDEGIVVEAEDLLQERLGQKGKTELTKSLLVFVKASSEYHMLLRHPQYAMLSEEDFLEAFETEHEHYREIMALHPYYVQLYLKAGIYWNYKSKTKSLLTEIFFSDLLQFESNHPYALFGQAEFTSKKKQQPQKAIQQYQQFLTQYPKLSVSNQMMKDYSIAEYLELPTSFNAFQHIARLYYAELEEYHQAIAYYQKAKGLVERHPALDWQIFAELLWIHQEDVESAMKLIESGLEVFEGKGLSKYHLFSLDPVDFKLNKAHLCELAGDLLQEEWQKTDLALKKYREALELVPRLIRVRLKQIRLIFHELQDYWQVDSLCRKVFEYSPQNSEAERYLKKAKEKRGIKT